MLSSLEGTFVLNLNEWSIFVLNHTGLVLDTSSLLSVFFCWRFLWTQARYSTLGLLLKVRFPREGTKTLVILPSGKLTWQWNMGLLKMYSLLKMGDFPASYLSLPECKCWNHPSLGGKKLNQKDCFLASFRKTSYHHISARFSGSMILPTYPGKIP